MLTFALIVVLIAALAIVLVRSIPMKPPLDWILQVVILVFAIYLIAHRAGLA